MKEVWKSIEGYEGLYEVSNLGRVKSLQGKKGDNYILSPISNVDGYCVVGLRKKGIYKQFRIHRIVAKHFIPNPENKSTVNHIDGNKQNNCVSNLEWCTMRENIKHAYANRLIECEKISKSKIDPKNINKNNTSGRKGVCFDKHSGKWKSYIRIKKKLYHLGLFETIDDAIKAREEKERELL